MLSRIPFKKKKKKKKKKSNEYLTCTFYAKTFKKMKTLVQPSHCTYRVHF